MDLEDRYLKLFLPNYNILTEVGSSFGYKHTEVDRKKMKDYYGDERRENIGILNRGKKLFLEAVGEMREKALNRPPMSDEIKKNVLHVQDRLFYIILMILFTVNTLLI